MPRSGWLALGAVVGALVGQGLGPPLAVVVVAGIGAATLIVAALLGATRAPSTLGARIAAVACAVGLLAVAARLVIGLALAGPVAASASPPASEHEWTATVLTLDGAREATQRATLLVAEAGGPPSVTYRVYAWLPRHPPLVPGDRIAFRSILEPPSTGPGFGDYLRGRGLAASVRVDHVDHLGSGGLAWLETLRRGAGDALALAVPEPQAGLAAGILIGLRDLVSRDVASDFTTAGLSHVVAIRAR